MRKPSEAIEQAKSRVNSLISDESVSEGARENLLALAEQIDQILHNLKETEKFIVFKGEERSFATLNQNIASLGEGILQLSPHIDNVVKKSDILNPLFVKGFDFHSFQVFTETERALSRAIGENFELIGPALYALRSTKHDDKRDGYYISFPTRDDDCFRKIHSLNKAFSFIDINGLLFKNKDGKFFPFTPETKGHVVNDERGIFSFCYKNKSFDSIVRGDWLTCYIHEIIKDQLGRLNIPHELYTKVTYKAPIDQIRHSSDFDVIGKYKDRLLMFECKSGSVNERTAEDIIQKSNAFSRVIEEIGGEKLHFDNFLVFDPFSNNEDEVRSLFGGDRIEAIKPSEVRPLIIQMTST